MYKVGTFHAMLTALEPIKPSHILPGSVLSTKQLKEKMLN